MNDFITQVTARSDDSEMEILFDVHLGTDMVDLSRAVVTGNENYAFLGILGNKNDIQAVLGFPSVVIPDPDGVMNTRYYILHSGQVIEMHSWKEE